MDTYPDISLFLEAKKKRRKVLVSLSWEEKVSIIKQMQTLLPRGKWKRGSNPTKDQMEYKENPVY